MSLHPLIIDVVSSVLKPTLQDVDFFVENVADRTFDAWFHTESENIAICDSVLSVLKLIMPQCLNKLECCETMVNFLWQTARFDDAVFYANQLFESCLACYGDHSSITGFIAKSVGGVYFNSGKTEQSVPWYRRALEYMLLSGDEISEDLAMAYEKVGRTYVWPYDRDFDKADACFEKALSIRKQIRADFASGKTSRMFHSREQVDDALIEERIGETYFEWGRMKQSQGDYRKALEYVTLSIQIGFPKHKELNCASGMAYNYFDAGSCYYHLSLQETDPAAAEDLLAKAENNLKTALDLNVVMRGTKSYDVIDNQELLADVYAAQGKIEEAVSAYEKAVEMLREIGGSNSERIERITGVLNTLKR